jgi:ribosome biogenesis GTPase A
MAKTKRMIQSQMRLVDVVIELLDARIPHSSRNPDISELCGTKNRITVLNKAGLADDKSTAEWLRHCESQNLTAIAADCQDGKGIQRIIQAVKDSTADKFLRLAAKGRVSYTTRAMAPT